METKVVEALARIWILANYFKTSALIATTKKLLSLQLGLDIFDFLPKRLQNLDFLDTVTKRTCLSRI